jgi:hypothetical protein
MKTCLPFTDSDFLRYSQLMSSEYIDNMSLDDSDFCEEIYSYLSTNNLLDWFHESYKELS